MIPYVIFFYVFKSSAFNTLILVAMFSPSGFWDSTLREVCACSFASFPSCPQPQAEVLRTQPWLCLASLPGPTPSHGLGTMDALMPFKPMDLTCLCSEIPAWIFICSLVSLLTSRSLRLYLSEVKFMIHPTTTLSPPPWQLISLTCSLSQEIATLPSSCSGHKSYSRP